jgi:hypothetical protein
MNYWKVILMRGEDILVTVEQKADIERAVLSGETHVKINDALVKVTNIAGIEETDQKVPITAPALPAAEEDQEERKTVPLLGKAKQVMNGQGDPVYDYDRPVLWDWAKKRINKRQLTKMDNPKVLGAEGGLTVIAFKQVIFVYEDTQEKAPLPHGVEWCDEYDKQELGVA